MKLRFKVQRYQTEAVEAVADCFAGQPLDHCAAGNAEIALSAARLLANIQAVQRARCLPVSPALMPSPAASTPGTPNLDVEMETGTGKTYVYLKTILELHRRYGWCRFIAVVPSVAIREGVRRTVDQTAEHFRQAYGSAPRSFCYSSSRLHELEVFSSDPGVQLMIINIQAFNSPGADSRRIYEVLDAFQSRRPIDVIGAARPVVIIDEPQRIGAAKSLAALSRLNPLVILRYSATHRVEHNAVYRLDARDAYQQKLVKKIAVRGITVRGLPGSSAYLYLDGIETAGGTGPLARVELEVRTSCGVSRKVKRLRAGASLHAASGGLEAYRGLVIADIDARRDVIEFSDGGILAMGQVTEDVTEQARRRIQIREVIRAHLDKERELFPFGIKVLSLFFIDEVARYRDYGRADTRGEYARCFAEQYAEQVGELLGRLSAADAGYRDYLAAIPAEDTHRGYFSVDRRTGRDIDGELRRAGEEQGLSADADAYDLILRDKERLLSLREPVRFIFSHSALREGWDNPNVFVLGMLKRSDSTVSRRQEVGRGLRLCVDQRGERMDDPHTVHEINELTVVTDESYAAFAIGLQREISASPGDLPPPPADGRRPTTGTGPGRDAAVVRRRADRADVAADLLAAFDSAELARQCVRALDVRLQVDTLEYLVSGGELRPGAGFIAATSGAAEHAATAATPSRLRYDLIGELATRTQLTRRTIAAILVQIQPTTFDRYRQNPAQFIAESARLIGEQVRAMDR
jgi:type III restriction enzyme